MRGLDLFFKRLIPQLREGETLGSPSIEGWMHSIRWDTPGFIGAGEDGLYQYINDPWLALTDTVIPGP